MELKIASACTKICAMCQYWNGMQGGYYVKPFDNASFEFDPNESKLCYKSRFIKKSAHSCEEWIGRYNH